MRGHPEKGLAHQGHHIFHLVLSHRLAHAIVRWLGGIVRPSDQKTRRNDARRFPRKDVARQLHPGKGIIGHVGVERLHHPMPIAPGMVAGLIVFEPIAFPKMNGVEPMPPPALPQMRRCQPAIHQSPPGMGSRITHKRLNILWIRGQAEQIITQSPNEGFAISGR